MEKKIILLILLVLPLLSLDCMGQKAGSGAIAFGHFVPYSTLKYHRQAVDMDSVEIRQQKEMERRLHRNRRRWTARGQRSFNIKFHNHTNLKKNEFKTSLSVQMDALQRDFCLDSLTYVQLMGETANGNDNCEIIIFNDIGNNHNPSLTPWTGWNTFDGDRNHQDHIDVHVSDNLPDTIGHGYARFGWLNRPDGADIVINASSFGSGTSNPFHGDKVLTHLMGNYLGLYPLFADYNCEDDHIFDTPIHNSPVTFCNRDQTPTTTCDEKPFMTYNFMTHTPDVCKDSFTTGQWRRMLNIIELLKGR